MTLSILSNTDPSLLELVQLPNSASAIHLEIDSATRVIDYSDRKTVVDELLHVQTWLDINLEDHESLADEEESSSEFIDRCCDGCEFYYQTETSDLNETIEVDGYDVYVHTVTHDSPCPCYSEGFHEVNFPCIRGESPSSADGMIHYRHLKAGVVLHANEDDYPSIYLHGRNSPYTMVIQSASRSETGDLLASYFSLPVNVYDDRSVCWGNDNTQPESLPEAVSQYLESPPNEDLSSVNDHNYRVAARSTAALKEIEGVVIDMPMTRGITNWDDLESEAKIPPQYVLAVACSSQSESVQNSYLRIATSPNAVFINGSQRTYACLLMERQLVDDGNGGSVELFRDAVANPGDHALCAMAPADKQLAPQLIGYAPLYQPQTPCTTTVSSSAPAELAHT